MNGLRGGGGLLALGLLVVASGLARAERTPVTRTQGQRANGTRPDITVASFQTFPYVAGRHFDVTTFEVKPP